MEQILATFLLSHNSKDPVITIFERGKFSTPIRIMTKEEAEHLRDDLDACLEHIEKLGI